MSRIIKATHLIMSFPRAIGYDNNGNNGNPGITEVQNDHEENKDGLTLVDAGGILAETEAMVNELLNEAGLKAKEIINNAREQASKIVEEGRAELERLKQEAAKTGYEDGFAAAQQALEGERERLLQETAAARAALEEERKSLVKEMEPKLLQLAIYIARQIVHAELKLYPEQIRSLTAAVLERTRDTGDVVLKVSPADYDEIVTMLEEAGQRKVKIEVENGLGRGCIAETSYGTVDGTVDGQMKEIARELLEVLPE